MGSLGCRVEEGLLFLMMHEQLLDRRYASQPLLPLKVEPTATDEYDLYPVTPVRSGSISRGFGAISERLIGAKTIRIDGFVGVFWNDFRERLQEAFSALGVMPSWIDVSVAQKEECQLNAMVKPFLGGDDPLFGKRFEGTLTDLFDMAQLNALQQNAQADCTIFYGCGAGLIESEGPLVYVDLPKSEVQFRSRAGSISNLGTSIPTDPKSAYKRFYFFDWPVLNRHKAELVGQVDWFVDEQRPEEVSIIAGDVLRDVFDRVSRGVFRVRPWFESGPWGGQRIKQLVPQLPQDVPNYAWSFELITPENGLLFSDGKNVLEVSFDWLMYHSAAEILGDCADRFGHDFPIRFNYLDTFDGGNLSVQCHPRTEYIQEQFGEPFTQDECYYIVDCKPGAEVYLGFTEDISPIAFAEELRRSVAERVEIDVKRFVNTEPTHRHDLFLIPGGTIHCSGANNLVLEISATTYIFTFKMYDWQRMDLDGTPRPLNIDRAMDNLYFDRKGTRIAEEFVSRPAEIAHGDNWRLLHLPTHTKHSYDIHRYEFDTEVTGNCDGSPHVMAMVAGSSVIVETANGMRRRFSFAETFVVPAAAESYRLINVGRQRAMVVKAFIKSTSIGERIEHDLSRH